jgi:hypothetical protein
MADNTSQPSASDPKEETTAPENGASSASAETAASTPESTPQSANPESASAETSAEGSAEQPASNEAASTETSTEKPAEDAPAEEAKPAEAGAETSAEATTESGEVKPAEGASADPANPTPASDDKQSLGAPKPPGNTPAQAAAPDKKKKILKFLIPIVVVMILGGIGGGVSYYLGFWGKKQVDTPVVQATDNTEATESASVEPELITPECVSGYKPYVNKLFSICYPITMDIKEFPATESAKAVTEFLFEDGVETLKVLTDYKDNLNKFDCASSKVVKVATYSAHRYLVKDPNPKGGCSGTINEYASLVSSGNDKPIFYIGLSRKSGSYQSDNGAFAAIEQSFRINLQ